MLANSQLKPCRPRRTALRVPVTSVFTPVRVNRPVTLQRLTSAGWKNIASGADVGAAFCATNDGETVVDICRGFADAAKTRHWARDTIVNVYSTATPWDSVECDIERTTVNTLTLRFSSAPTTNQLTCVVIG